MLSGPGADPDIAERLTHERSPLDGDTHDVTHIIDTEGPDTALSYTNSAGVETETSGKKDRETTTKSSSILPKDDHDPTPTDRSLLPGSTMANLPIVVDLATTFA